MIFLTLSIESKNFFARFMVAYTFTHMAVRSIKCPSITPVGLLSSETVQK